MKVLFLFVLYTQRVPDFPESFLCPAEDHTDILWQIPLKHRKICFRIHHMPKLHFVVVIL